MKARTFNPRYRILFFATYLLLATLYFLPFITRMLLPGNHDVWFNLAMFKDVSNLIDHYLFGEAYYTADFPSGKIYTYGESSFLSCAIFWLLQKLTTSDYHAFLSLYILFYALNSYMFYKVLSELFRIRHGIAFVGGIFFSFCAFNLALSDNLPYIIFFPAFAALVRAHRWTRDTGKIIHLYLAGLFLSLQIYFSVYNFLMGLIMIICWVFISRSHRFTLKNSIATLSIITVITFPFVYLYGFNDPTAKVLKDFFSPEVLDRMGFYVEDLRRSFSSNLVYGKQMEPANKLHYYTHIGNIGMFSFLFSIVGIYIAYLKEKKFLMFLFATGLLLCMGPYWFGLSIPSVTYPLYAFLPILPKFKLLFKFYYLAVIAVICGLVLFEQHIQTSGIAKGLKIFLLILIPLVFIFENIPADPVENSTPYHITSLDKDLVRQWRKDKKPVLFLPTYTPILPEDGKGTEFQDGRTREYKYYYLQAKYGFNSLNGTNVFISKNKEKINQFLDNNDITGLSKEYDLAGIIIDKKATLSDSIPGETYLRKEYPEFVYYPL